MSRYKYTPLGTYAGIGYNCTVAQGPRVHHQVENVLHLGVCVGRHMHMHTNCMHAPGYNCTRYAYRGACTRVPRYRYMYISGVDTGIAICIPRVPRYR